jgi:hypothetical protein
MEYFILIKSTYAQIMLAQDLSTLMANLNAGETNPNILHTVLSYTPVEISNQLEGLHIYASEGYDPSDVRNNFTQVDLGISRTFTGVNTPVGRAELSAFIDSMKEL